MAIRSQDVGTMRKPIHYQAQSLYFIVGETQAEREAITCP